MSDLTFEQFINELESKGLPLKKLTDGYHANCPSCGGSSGTNLHISQGEKQEILTKCFRSGCSHDEVMKAFGFEKKGVSKGKKKGEKAEGATLEDIANVKKIGRDFLKKLGCKNTKWKDRDWDYEVDALEIPYEPGLARVRISKNNKDKFRWRRAKKNVTRAYKPVPFKSDTIYMVEGESDVWTLLLHGFDAIGIPGAQGYNCLYLDQIKGVNHIYIIQENDDAGKIFAEKICIRLGEIKFGGQVHVIDMGILNYKDVSQIHCRKKEQFKSILKIASDNASTKNHRFRSVGDEHVFHIYSDRIVYLDMKRNAKLEVIKEPKTIINQGVIVESVHKDVFNDDYTVTLRWGRGKRKSFPLDVLLHAKRHGELSRHGVLSDSNNSRYIVTYFNTVVSQLIKENEKMSSTRNGWVPGEGFVYGDKMITKNGDRHVEFDAVEYTPTRKGEKGAQKKALDYMAKDIQVALKMGAAAASPIVEQIGCENFTHHCQGDSGRGKTAGSKCCASLYAMPTKILNSWESSKAGIETIIEEAGGLPVFLEESHKGNPDSVLQTTYAFANKKQPAKSEMRDGRRYRRKSAKMSGVIISTGEWSISGLSADGGATARLLEEHKKRFDMPKHAENIEKYTADLEENHGHYGEEIIRHFIHNKAIAIQSFDNYKKELRQSAEGGIQYRQIPYFAACLVGCDILRELGLEMPSVEDLKECCIETMSSRPKSLYDKAIEYLIGCVDEYQNKFYYYEKIDNGKYLMTGDPRGDVNGLVDEQAHIIYIYSKVFTDWVTKNQMSRTAVLQALDEKGVLVKDSRKDGKKTFTKRKRIDDKLKVTVAINVPEEFREDEKSKVDKGDDDNKQPKGEDKPKQTAPVAAPVEKEKTHEDIHLEAYYDEGYNLTPTSSVDSKRGLRKFDLEHNGKYLGTEWAKDIMSAKRAAVKIFARHKQEMEDKNNSIEVWKKNNQSVVTKEMVEDARTTEYDMFEEEYSQYDDERGQ